MSFCIVTDSGANMPQDLVERHGIYVVPLTYTVNGEEHSCADLSTFDGSAFYQQLRQKVEVKTSLVNESRFLEVFRPLVAAGRDLLYLGISSGISGTYAAAERAVAQLRTEFPHRQLFTVDTLGASMGEGLLVLWAAALRAAGETIRTVYTSLLSRRQKLCQEFTVDDLMFLKRGGRLSAAAAVMGTVLQVKPLLKANEAGEIILHGKVRGRKASLKALCQACVEKIVDPGQQTLFIAHGDCAEDAGYLENMLREAVHPQNVVNVIYEPVTGSHVGPGAVALFFFGSRR